MLPPGLYEQIINEKLDKELSVVPEACQSTASIDKAEASTILAQYVSDIIKEGLDNISDSGGDLTAQIALVNQIVDIVVRVTQDIDFNELAVSNRAEQLLAIIQENNPIFLLKKTAKDLARPETSIAQSSLFTGAIYEPQMFSELKKEIQSANEIDMLVSFIKWSGLRAIIDELQEFTQNGGNLRVITTSYMGVTDVKAIEELNKLMNTEIKISYDTTRTRLHAKAYLFHRDTGFTTAYVGSSNLSNVAISSGLEWNVKIAAKDLPTTIQKIIATFDSYWNSTEFERYTDDKKERLHRALNAERITSSNNNHQLTFDIHPYSYQQEILDKLNTDREVRHQFKNLVVAATGTGKTVISAFDYRNFSLAHPGQINRLLFVAHREEILKQSRDTFQGILRDLNFGELFVGNYKPKNLDHLFISIQTVNSQDICEKLPANYYDYIVVDEFHHAAAPTYQKLLNHFQPKILLGLTATPERMDGKSVLDYFDGRVTAEIRLPEAINRNLLCPFQYFGVTDTVNLSDIRWTRGGYEVSDLTALYALNRPIAERRANNVILAIKKYLTDIDSIKGLGFCVSVEHAKFMSEHFNANNIPSIFLAGSSSHEDRHTAKQRLVSGELQFIFVVDIYNEGVDIPEVNTILFLRPTESLTIFLQQLGRGLRLSNGKECLTVLDFIGQANKKYNFEEKFSALLSNTSQNVLHELKNGFVSVPKGCYIQLEKKAANYILDNIKNSFNTKSGLIQFLSTFEEDSGLPLTLSNFLNYYHLDVFHIYTKFSFARLCVSAGIKSNFSEPVEEILTTAFRRLASINSRRWISFLLEILPRLDSLDFSALSQIQQRMLQMFYITVWMRPVENWNNEEVLRNFHSISKSPVMLAELIELLEYSLDRIDFVDEGVDLGFECPLDLYCNYTRDQILVAMDYMTPSNVREGVKWLPEKK